jgi:hypothetical protein
MLEEILDSIPPQPQPAIEETCRNEHRRRAVEFRKQVARKPGLIGVTVVQREGDSTTGAPIAFGQPLEQLLESDERITLTAQPPEYVSQRLWIVSWSPAVEIMDSVQAEDRRPVPHQWGEETRKSPRREP